MTLRVYVAGASKEPERVRAAMEAVRAAGFKITLDWLAAIEEAGAANEGLSDEDRRRYAKEDLRSVQRADVVWVLAPESTSTGAWVELGFALAIRDGCGWNDLAIVVSGAARTRCIFAALADAEFDSDEEALAWVLSEGRR